MLQAAAEKPEGSNGFNSRSELIAAKGREAIHVVGFAVAPSTNRSKTRRLRQKSQLGNDWAP